MVQCKVLVAFGCNLPSSEGRKPLDTCIWAVSRVAEMCGLSLSAVSRWYQTRPVPPSDQPDYVNGVALFAGTVEPHRLLMALQAIEAEAGRVRSVPNAARLLDLDLLAVDGVVLQTPDLVLPHPRMQERAFVLAPLCDVAPDWVHPVLGLSAAAMLARVGQAGVDLLACGQTGASAATDLAN